MKKFNQLLDSINEAEDTPWGGNSVSAHSHYGLHRTENPFQVERINSFLYNMLTGKTHQSPAATLIAIKNKLNMIGLDFSIKDIPGDVDPKIENHLTIPLTRFGGTFGTSPQHDLLRQGFEVTDGFNGNSLNMNVKISPNSNGLFNIFATIEQQVSAL